MAGVREVRWRRVMTWTICVAMSFFHLYTAQFGMLSVLLQRSVHLTFALVLVFLLYPLGGKGHKGWMDALDFALAALALLSIGYVAINYEDISVREVLASPVSDTEFILGIIAIFLVLEATRRTVGIPLTVVVIFALVYVYAGPYFPGQFGHRGWLITNIIAFMYLSLEGIFGIPLGVSATYAFLFILFGAFLYATGVGHFFITLATSVAGKSSGGGTNTLVYRDIGDSKDRLTYTVDADGNRSAVVRDGG